MTKPPMILVVEDDPALLNRLDDLLTAAGYRVLRCMSGYDAHRMLFAEPLALVILKTHFTDGTHGRALLELMRLNPLTRNIPVIAYSTDPHECEEIECFTLHMPFRDDELLAAVRQALAPPGEANLDAVAL